MTLLESAKKLQEEIIAHRTFLHQNPELGMSLPITSEYVETKLTEMGITVMRMGESAITALIGNGKGKTVLLRADMDALPILEETDEAFASTNGAMHACGHDLHTSVLLGAAKLLKERETEINGYVKLMFQPAEETLEGAKFMVENGILENPKVDAAMMMHVMTGAPVPAGLVVVPVAGKVSASSDIFDIKVFGKGGHGAMPQETVDPLNIASHIHLSLQEIISREVAAFDPVVVTIGAIIGGDAFNVIPDQAILKGTIRTFDGKTREYVKKRVVEIAESVATTFRGRAQVIYQNGCPSVSNDGGLVSIMNGAAKKIVGEKRVFPLDALMPGGKMMGSEDFSYVTEHVPSVMISLTTGDANNGYIYPMHHPKAKFDTTSIYEGAAVYAQFALDYLEG